MASWRSKQGLGVGNACHLLYRLQGAEQAQRERAAAAACCTAAAAGSLLSGHVSATTLTASALLDLGAAEPLLLSADEASQAPVAWHVGGGGPPLRQAWTPLPSPVRQLGGGVMRLAGEHVPLAAACCDSELRLYTGHWRGA